MADANPTAEYGTLGFQEQTDYFRGKLRNVPTRTWTEVYGAAHDQGFMVAGAMKADLLVDLRGAVDRAITQGTTLAQFRNDFDQLVAKHGWVYNGGRNWRTRVIYETNLFQSYNAGREAQMNDPAIRRRRPFGLYRHYRSPFEREEHLAWNNLVLPLDHPWWKTHSPQNGWGCKCRKFTLSERELKSRGLKVAEDSEIPFGDELVEQTIGVRGPSPRTVRVPRGIDPGFEHRPGDTTLGQGAEQMIIKTAPLPPAQAARAVEKTLARPRVAEALGKAFAEFVDEVAAEGKSRNRLFGVGAVKPRVLDELAKFDAPISTAAITIRDVDLMHAVRDAKAGAVTASGKRKALTLDELKALPSILSMPRAVLLHPADGLLFMVFDPQDPIRSAAKVVIMVNARIKGSEGNVVTNSFRTASLIETLDLQKEVRAGTLRLLEGGL